MILVVKHKKLKPPYENLSFYYFDTFYFKLLMIILSQQKNRSVFFVQHYTDLPRGQRLMIWPWLRPLVSPLQCVRVQWDWVVDRIRDVVVSVGINVESWKTNSNSIISMHYTSEKMYIQEFC